MKSPHRFILISVWILFFAVGASAAQTGVISGRVTNDSGTGIANIDVKVYSIPKQCLIASDKTDLEGYYMIAPINEGFYKIYFDDDTPKLYLSEWWDNQTSYSKANVARVIGDQTTTINGQLTLGGIITGKVTNRSNVALNNVAIYKKESNSNSGASSTGRTNSSGIYSIRQIPPGSYIIFFNGADAGYNLRYWNDKGTLAEADPVIVPSGITVPNINGQLDLNGSISGKITNQSGTPIKNVQIWAYDPNKKSVNNVMNNSTTGIYTVKGLPTGVYKVWFDARSANNYLSEWYDNQPSFETGQTVSVVNGSTTPDIDAQLSPGGAITGKVTNQNGEGIYGITVRAYDSSHDSIDSDSTDADGNYLVHGLPTGNYRVYFSGYSSCTTEACYSSEWYDDKRTFDTANPVSVVVEQTTSNINAVLGNCPDKFVYLPVLLK